MCLQEVEIVASQIDVFQSVLFDPVVSKSWLKGELPIARITITCNGNTKDVCRGAKESFPFALAPQKTELMSGGLSRFIG